MGFRVWGSGFQKGVGFRVSVLGWDFISRLILAIAGAIELMVYRDYKSLHVTATERVE